MPDVKLIHGDCLEILPTLTEQVDAIITDLPYGTTACKWDIIIPFEPMWEQVRRVLKPRGVFVTTASQPFTSLLICSNLEWFKYEWIWNKIDPSGALNVKVMPLKQHENILVFCEGKTVYNRQFTKKPKINQRPNRKNNAIKRGEFAEQGIYGAHKKIMSDEYDTTRTNPKSIIVISHSITKRSATHPTQKPVALYEYLIRTYTNEGDTILDIAAGSGTTGEAAIKTNRNCILIEKEEKYFSIAQRRIKDALQQPNLFHG